MDQGEQLSLLGGFAAEQWGLVTSAQAKDAGLNGVQLLRLTEAALLEKVAHGVYLLAAAGQPQHLEIKVAWLRLQPAVPAWSRSPGDRDSGVVSHASACQLQELGDIPAPEVEISVPRRRVTTDAAVRLRTAVVDPSDLTVVDGLPVTNAHRTILDLLAAKADGGHVGGVIAEAERRELVSMDGLAEDVSRFARRYGMPRSSDGADLIDHLVAQAGESLRSQQLERATEAGFASALQLLSRPELQPALPSLQEFLQGQRSSADLQPVLANWQKVLRDVAAPSLQTQMQGVLEAIAQSTGAHRLNEAFYAALRKSLPPPTDFHRILREAAPPSPAVEQVFSALQKMQLQLQTQEPERAAIEAADEQVEKPADTDDREP
ncbi:type IV toxin-antitoxin system AbiEi family antitoxin domain-containing protein [Streptomyces sp. MS2.AVA.5]|uniref:Type IV toxin-antitoxin system AbiEi family antitoxin domain-containing protein n=1 Tax=Streptomyces achmelvichensis TaxID=3134111 RepID=A0ACC6PTH9_9ACTN